VCNILFLSRENKKRERAGGFNGEVETDPEVGDRSIHFKYIL
jgi:hypothetical protein